MTRLRARSDDPLRKMTRKMVELPWPGHVSRDISFPYGDLYESIKFDALYRRQNEFKGDFVFHYTSAETFEKLISSEADLLLSRFNEMNDDEEVIYGWSQVLCFLEWTDGIQGLKLRLFRQAFDYRMYHTSQVPWVVSFSESPDSLSQWGMYTDRKLGGCSIAFDFRELNYAAERIQRGGSRDFDVFFLPCYYHHDDVRRILELWFEGCREVFGVIQKEEYKTVKSQRCELIEPLMFDMLMLATIIKYPGFEAEREWRLIIVPKHSESLEPVLLHGKYRYGINKCFSDRKPIYTMRWIRGVGASPHPKDSRSDRFWHLFDSFCAAGRRQWETGAWQSEIPYNGR